MGLNLLSRILFIAIFAIGSLSSNLAPRQTCSSGYSLCSPPGATGSSTYDIGDGLIHLYANLLDTVNPHAPAPGAQPQPVSPNGPAKRQSVNAMCCASSLSCYLLQGSGVPMCYDKFTTDYALPNGDYGTVSNGTLITSSGARVDLINGNYTVPNGQTGNIYATATSEMPNTATLAIPTQYTSTSVGSAVPASQLGSSASYTTHLTTITAASVTSSPLASLSGPAVIPCSTCCARCGIPSTTTGVAMPSITSLRSGSLPSVVSSTGSPGLTPSVAVGAVTMNKMELSYLAISMVTAGAFALVL